MSNSSWLYRPREGVPPDNRRRKPKDLAEGTDFVFEKIAQRLNQLKPQFVGKASDIVMQLDICGCTRQRVATLDYIRVKRALREKLDVLANI